MYVYGACIGDVAGSISGGQDVDLAWQCCLLCEADRTLKAAAFKPHCPLPCETDQLRALSIYDMPEEL